MTQAQLNCWPVIGPPQKDEPVLWWKSTRKAHHVADGDPTNERVEVGALPNTLHLLGVHDSFNWHEQIDWDANHPNNTDPAARLPVPYSGWRT